MNDHRDILKEAIRESNAIEGLPHTGLYRKNSELAVELCLIAAEVNEVVHPRALHAVVMRGLPLPTTHLPGQYRMCDVRVGEWVAPPAQQVSNYMEFWWDLAIEEDPWSSHAQFEAIHPFPDGNGRVGRLLYWNQQMLHGEAPTIIRAAEREAYYERLEEYRRLNWEEA